MLERLVAIRLLAYLDESGLMPTMQSAYRRNHSTETAVLRVLSDILLALDRGDFAALALLDLSAAFDTVGVIGLGGPTTPGGVARIAGPRTTDGPKYDARQNPEAGRGPLEPDRKQKYEPEVVSAE